MCTVLLPPGVNPIAFNKYIYTTCLKTQDNNVWPHLDRVEQQSPLRYGHCHSVPSVRYAAATGNTAGLRFPSALHRQRKRHCLSVKWVWVRSRLIQLLCAINMAQSYKTQALIYWGSFELGTVINRSKPNSRPFYHLQEVIQLLKSFPLPQKHN